MEITKNQLIRLCFGESVVVENSEISKEAHPLYPKVECKSICVIKVERGAAYFEYYSNGVQTESKVLCNSFAGETLFKDIFGGLS